MKELESRVKAWAASPIGPINQWYTPKLETRLTSAIQFLAGDLPGKLHFVLSYIEAVPLFNFPILIKYSLVNDNPRDLVSFL